MDIQPTLKKLKVLKTEDDGSSSGKRDGVSCNAERIKDVQDQDYFTPALMDVWPKVLDYVTDSKDVLSAMNASTVFYSLLEKRKASALLPLVLPILINQNTDRFTRRDVFKCRFVSKRMRTSVDNFLINYKLRDVYYGKGSYSLCIVGVSEALLNVTPGINWNPFVARCCEVDLNEHCHTDNLEVLQRYGYELHKVDLILGYYDTPAEEMNILKRALRCLPNLQSLVLEFPWRGVEEAEELKNFNTPTDYLPALNSLTKLTLKTRFDFCETNDDDDETNDDDDEPVYSPPSFVRPILLTYGNQLTSLYCESFVFSENHWRSISFPILLHLEVLFRDGESSEWIKNLAEFKCPQLCSLTFTVKGLGTEIFSALNNFRSSLKKLHFKSSLGAALQLFQVDPLDVREFPQLTCLILSPEDAETPARHLFRMMFPKLKELKFQHASNKQGVPDESVRSGYFTMFPDLKRITWTQREYRTGARPPLHTETVFTRQNYG